MTLLYTAPVGHLPFVLILSSLAHFPVVGLVSILANDGYIDLNCETHNAYDAQGFCNGYVKSDDFPDLKPGKNHIAWNGAVDHVEITPRWWTL